MRRAEIGHHHQISGNYLLRHAQEAAWREDDRREANGSQVERLARLRMKHKPSLKSSKGITLATGRLWNPTRRRWKTNRPTIAAREGSLRGSSAKLGLQFFVEVLFRALGRAATAIVEVTLDF